MFVSVLAFTGVPNPEVLTVQISREHYNPDPSGPRYRYLSAEKCSSE